MGRDVLQKTIKGTETSMFVGLVAALLAALLATVFGALAAITEAGSTISFTGSTASTLDTLPAADPRYRRRAEPEGDAHVILILGSPADRDLPADPRES